MRDKLFLRLFALSVLTWWGCATAPGTAPPPPTSEAPTAASSETPTAGVEAPAPPRAAARTHRLEAHGHVREDDYYWLRERENPEVIRYLEEENAYTEAVMADTKELQEELFEEIVARIPQEDETPPYLLNGYWYSVRYDEGKEYPIFVRRKGSPDAPEEVVIDANELAEGHEFFSIRGPVVSDGTKLAAFATDTVGRRFYTLRFRDLTTGEYLPDAIPDVTGNVAWAADDRTVFYTKQHPETLRSFQVRSHELGTDPAGDRLVYQEDDETFNTWVWKTKSREYIVIHSSQTLADEARILRADDPEGEPQVFQPRERGHEYRIEHAGDSFYVRTNLDAKNFRLMKTPLDATGKESWQEVVPHRDDVYLGGFEVFEDHLVLSERERGLVGLRVIPREGGDDHYLAFDEPAYVAWISQNPQYETSTLRFGYSSMTTPASIYDYDMETRERTLLKRDQVGGGFDSANYETERLYASARDGARVPVSLVWRKGMRRDEGNPLLLYGYGSYGATIDPSFSSPRLSLLDRGFVFAIAHIRGGQVMGRDWYEQGKLLHKKNTFADFVDAAEHLTREGWTTPDHLYAMGGSAGGLLMGAVVNMRPDLFRGVVAHVPFVDVITTMLDPDIPLTTGEYDEWGDPNQREYYEYILSYSPYDNVGPMDYPAMLVTTGLHDSQVQYWEPAKWVAKLRALRTDDDLLLLRTNMEAGHGGATGRFKRHRETAFDYAFLLRLEDETQ